MTRLRAGVVRYASIGNAIAEAIGVDPLPDCEIGGGRITITFRGHGRSRWTEPRQIEEALRVAAVTRGILVADSRRAVRERASSRAVVVIYEDPGLVRGCSVVARWECVVPVDA
jgi:hypothetical protein